MKISVYHQKLLAINVLVWLAYIGINLSALYADASRANNSVDMLKYLTGYSVSFMPWIVATPIFYYFLNRAYNHKQNTITAIVVMFVIWFPFVFFFESLSTSIIRSISNQSLWQVGLKLPNWYWIYSAMLYSAAIGICFSLIVSRKMTKSREESSKIKAENVQLALQLSELKMNALQSQLEPHFLFNALNAITSLVRIDHKQDALEAIQKLSNLLRYAVESSKKQLVLLNSELDFVNDYLALQKLRFDDKLNFSFIDVRKNLNQECPPFLLQIFIENAIRHGLEKTGEAVELSLKLSDPNNQLTIHISNSCNPSINQVETLGVGLKNIKQRLSILYQDNYDLTIEQTKQQFNVNLTFSH